jgi:hypothetical protein
VIPALLAAPMVQGIVGSVAGSIAGTVESLFSQPSSTPASSASFNPYLERAGQGATTAYAPSPYSTPSGSLTTLDWSQMSPTDIQSWMQSLGGKFVRATDVSGRTVSGVVNGLVQNGGVPALNVGGHLVSLSQVNQITWSPAIH